MTAAQPSQSAPQSPPLGRLLVVGIPGPELDAATAEYLHAVQPGAVILFRRNLPARVEDLARLIEALHALPWHPLVSIDHEGGRVVRLGEPFTRFPPMAVLGASGDEALAQAVGEAMGRELSAVGFDVVYAPVLDVASCPHNPVIGDRALSSDPQRVARLGCALARGFLRGGVLPCAKHFPGHGDTDADSHVALPRVTASRATLAERELVPFRAAVQAGIPALMTAHVVYPAWDAARPATLSAAILQRVLREQLGFGGLVLSDDLEMAAIAEKAALGVAAAQALEAGADGLLVCQTAEAAVGVRQALQQAWQDGTLLPDTVTRALAHWDDFQRKLPAARSACPLPCPEHRRLAALLGS